MTVSDSVIQWLQGFDASRLKTINTDMMAAEVKSYALMKEPVQNIQHFLSGRKVVTDHYTLMARLASKTESSRQGNAGFGEALSQWISERHQAGDFPAVEGAKVQSIEVTTPFYLGQSKENDSLYQMTVAIKYMKEN